MAKINRPAARVRQGSLTLYATSLKVSDLLIPNFYSVETLDPDDTSDRGYQRLLNKTRAKKLADYIVDGQETLDAFLPTSIFLATDKDLPFDSASNSIEIDTDKVGAFSVVDGQHRVEGLKMAAEKDVRVRDFEVPVNIAVDLKQIAQMSHFLIVNTTQRSVDQGVEQRIIARLTKAVELEETPTLPKWIAKLVLKGEDERALKYVDYLNNTKESPWFNKIEMANDDENDDASVKQKTFVKAIKKFVLVANNPITTFPEDKQHGIFLNYWKAIAEILVPQNSDEPQPTVLFKYVGVELFARFCVPFMNKVINTKNFKVSAMKEILLKTFDNMDGEYIGVGHTDFWVKGGKAGQLNASALSSINGDMVKALHKVDNSSEIQL